MSSLVRVSYYSGSLDGIRDYISRIDDMSVVFMPHHK